MLTLPIAIQLEHGSNLNLMLDLISNLRDRSLTRKI